MSGLISNVCYGCGHKRIDRFVTLVLENQGVQSKERGSQEGRERFGTKIQKEQAIAHVLGCLLRRPPSF